MPIPDAPSEVTARDPEQHHGMMSIAQDIWSMNAQAWKDVLYGKGTWKEDLVVAAEATAAGLLAGAAIGAGTVGLAGTLVTGAIDSEVVAAAGQAAAIGGVSGAAGGGLLGTLVGLQDRADSVLRNFQE